MTASGRRQMRTIRKGIAFASLAAGVAAASAAIAQEPSECSSASVSDWPTPSKPYFMVLVDTSGSMFDSVPPPENSCGYTPNNRISHAKCALRKMAEAFGGQVNFGLATFPYRTHCPDG